MKSLDQGNRNHKSKNPEISYTNITLKYKSQKVLLKSIKFTMQLRYYYSDGALTPLDGADTLRMLQFLELDHSQAKPHTLSCQARP